MTAQHSMEKQTEFTLGNQNLSHEILLADIKYDEILGIDFLCADRCDVLLSKGHLVLNGEKTVCFRRTNEAKLGCCRIALTENVQVPPGKEMIVKGRPLDKFNKDGLGILEASEMFALHYGLLVARAFACPKLGRVPLRLMNLLDKTCFLHKSTVAVVYEPVHEERVETDGVLGTQNTVLDSSTDSQNSTAVHSLGQEFSVPGSSLDLDEFEMGSSLETMASDSVTSSNKINHLYGTLLPKLLLTSSRTC